MSPAQTNKLNKRQRNEQPNECKANERPITTQLNRRMVESADRRATTTTTSRTSSIRKPLYIQPTNLGKI